MTRCQATLLTLKQAVMVTAAVVWTTVAAEAPLSALVVPHAPPPGLPVQQLAGAPAGTSSSVRPAALGSTYSIGNPTDEEQWLVEMVNRARKDPVGEAVRMLTTTDEATLNAYRFFQVDTNLMVAQVRTNLPAPPLSISGALTVSARGHSLDMLTNAFQAHTGSDGSNPGTRIAAAGYSALTYGENIFAYGVNVPYSHASFIVDWGIGAGGMQVPPGHRDTIYDAELREVGAGIIYGTNQDVGPLVITQDFGTAFGQTPFITGVAYYDFNTNAFYDPGEGIGDVTVTVDGVTTSAVTADSGGYSVPVTGDGVYTVHFSGPGLVATQQKVTVAGAKNVKLDFLPSYQPPVVAGPVAPLLGQSNAYQFTAVGGANAYQWRLVGVTATNLIDVATNGFALFAPSTTPGYSPIATGAGLPGNAAFQLVHLSPVPQALTLVPLVRLGPAASLSFASRLGWAASGEIARAQISTDQGATWVDLWSAAGTDSAGETTFTTHSIPLAAYAGKEVALRYFYDFGGGTFYNQAGVGVGFYIGNIQLNGVFELSNAMVSDVLSGTAFSYIPTAAGSYSLAVRARVSTHWLSWGPPLDATVSATVPPAQIQINLFQPVSSNRFELNFVISAGATNRYVLQSAPSPSGPWTTDPSVVPTTTAVGQYQVILASPASAQMYYRIGGL